MEARDADGNVSDVQESQSQQSQLRRSDTDLQRLRSESGESHTEEESLLYTPCTRAGKRSFVWDYGGCKKKDGKLITDRIYCAKCDKEFKYQGTCGNLQTHLKNIHQITEETNKPQEPSTPQSSQSRIDSLFKPSAKVENKYRNDNAKQKKFRTLTCQ